MKMCYYVDEAIKNDKGEFIPVIIKEGVGGYFKTDYNWGPDLNIAENAMKRKNKNLGLTEEEVEEMICKSMFVWGRKE